MRLLRGYLPDIASFAAMVLLAAEADVLLHAAGAASAGLYAGYVGSLVIGLSFAYSLRKRKAVRWGSAPKFLVFHKIAAWVGSLLILVHGGFHFNALLPWLAMLLLVVVVGSGLTGSILLKRARGELFTERKQLAMAGMPSDEIERKLHHAAVAVDVMKKWRVVHLPLTTCLVALVFLHVASVLAFWNW